MKMRSRSDQRSAGTSLARLRADEEQRSDVLPLASPVGHRCGHELHPRVHVREQALVELQHGRVDTPERELASSDPRLELRKHRLRVGAGQRPRLRDGHRVGESTGAPRGSRADSRPAARCTRRSRPPAVRRSARARPLARPPRRRERETAARGRLPASRPREPRHRPRAGAARRAPRAVLRGSARSPWATRSAPKRRRPGGGR